MIFSEDFHVKGVNANSRLCHVHVLHAFMPSEILPGFERQAFLNCSVHAEMCIVMTCKHVMCCMHAMTNAEIAVAVNKLDAEAKTGRRYDTYYVHDRSL